MTRIGNPNEPFVQNRILKNTALGWSADFFSYGLTFFAAMILARTLGPEGRGQYALITALNIYGIILCMWGMGAAAETHVAKKQYSLAAVHTFALIYSAVTGLSAFMIFAAAWSFISPFLGTQPDRTLMSVSMLLLPFSIYSDIAVRTLISLGDIRTLSLFKITKSLLILSGPIVFLLIYPLGLAGAVAAWGLAILLPALFLGVLLFKKSGWNFAWEKGILKDSFNFGFQVHMAFLPTAILMQIDTFILNYFHGASEVGLYAVAANLTLKGVLFFGAVIDASQKTVIASNREEASSLLRRLIRHSVFMIGLFIVGIFLAGPFAVEALYGPAYRKSAFLLLALSPGMLAWVLINYLNLYAVGQLKNPALSGKVNYLHFVICMGLYFYAIPKWGAWGAAFAVSLAAVLKVGLYLVFLNWHSISSLRQTFVLQKEDWVLWQGYWQGLRQKMEKNR